MRSLTLAKKVTALKSLSASSISTPDLPLKKSDTKFHNGADVAEELAKHDKHLS